MTELTYCSVCETPMPNDSDEEWLHHLRLHTPREVARAILGEPEIGARRRAMTLIEIRDEMLVLMPTETR